MQTTPLMDSYQSAHSEKGAKSVECPSSPLDQLDNLLERKRNASSLDSADFLISGDRITAEAASLQPKTLSAQLASWVDRYDKVGDRNPYLWTWCRQGVELTTLPCVLTGAFDEVCDTKVLGVMLDVLIDDVADQGGNERLLKQLIGVPFSDQPGDWLSFTERENEYAVFTESVWNEVQRRVECFPRYAALADLLRYDYLQLMNTMRYAHLLNRFPSLLNLAEHDLYLPHNMHMMVSATMDLMCSPDFDFDEIGRLREAIWQAQYMGRIGNLVTTWKRELYEGDFTSGVFAHAVIYGDLSLDRLQGDDRAVIENVIRDGGHEEYFLQKWQEHRRHLIALQGSIRSVDLVPLIHGLERLICLHLASRGMK